MPRARRRKTPRTGDRGNTRAQAMQAKFGIFCADALGRAYAFGLLGDDNDARAMLDTGRRIASIYRARFDHGRPRCSLAASYGGRPEDVAKVKAEDRWLAVRLDAVRRRGPAVAKAFLDLVIEDNPDVGPPWLDRLIAAADGGELTRDELSPLAAALEGLEAAL